MKENQIENKDADLVTYQLRAGSVIRLNEFLEKNHVTTKRLSEILGITHAAVSMVRSGRNQMGGETFRKFIAGFPDLCICWLMRGEDCHACKAKNDLNSTAGNQSSEAEIRMLKELLASKDMLINAKDEIIQMLKRSNS